MIARYLFIGTVFMTSLYITSSDKVKRDKKPIFSEICNKSVALVQVQKIEKAPQEGTSKAIKYCVCHPDKNFIVKTSEFCPHVYESFKNAMKPATYCWFNKGRREKDGTQLTHVACSVKEKANVIVLDEIDRIIFRKEKAPYSYQKIMSALNINTYVLKNEYETLCQYWIFELNALAGSCMAVSHTDGARSSSNQDICLKQQVFSRVKKYLSFLECSTQYQHSCCVGLIVPTRAVLCLKIVDSCVLIQG